MAQIPDLTLPGGGTVTFIDDANLNGLQYRALRKVWANQSADEGDLLAAVAATLIASWDIPDRPGLPKPHFEADGVTPNVGTYQGLGWQDVEALEVALRPFARRIIGGPPVPKEQSTE